MNNLKRNQILKWLLVSMFLFFAFFTLLKDRGYCDEMENNYVDPGEEFSYEFPNPSIPLECEYLYQHRYSELHKKPICYYSKWVDPYEHIWENDPRKIRNKTRVQKRKEWQESYDHHHYDAVRTYNDAYNRIWWLPDLTLRQLGRDAWVAACVIASTKTPGQALVAAFTTMLSQYGLHCLDEWDYIQDKLYWSHYHFKECAFYANLLQK